MAGGWAQAARLPALEALAYAEDHLRERRHAAYAQALQSWAAMLPAFAWGGTPPPAPELDED